MSTSLSLVSLSIDKFNAHCFINNVITHDMGFFGCWVKNMQEQEI